MNGDWRYARDFPGPVTPGPMSGWYPGAFWGAAPMWGWGGWGWPPAPYAPVGYGRYPRDYTPRRPPHQSETYGSGGDRAVRRYARSHGYDEGYAIRPHPRRGAAGRGRYDRPLR